MKGLIGSLAGLFLLTGCVATRSGGPSSQPLDCALTGGLTAPVGTQWVDAAYAAIEDWPKPGAIGLWDLESLGSPTARHIRSVATLADAPHAAIFPATAYVVRTDVEGVAVATLFRFYEEREDGLYWLGDSDETLAVTVSPPQKFLPRTLRVGQRWEQRYRDSRFEVEVTSEHEVIGCGEVRVPAGRFANALLLRSSYRYADSPASSIVHSWHAPEVGLVAAATVSSVAESTATVSALLEYRPAGR
ncbi:MAG: hypothetical protein KatS3mg060_1014 [Dehalococcoidia bacterium]|nr:MAG: hypothetical protein KatS3mg060_1014 [Dehalococcoidia bacterium]